jgi:(p)ppGpp synthase/HD superfamily hydrolase
MSYIFELLGICSQRRKSDFGSTTGVKPVINRFSNRKQNVLELEHSKYNETYFSRHEMETALRDRGVNVVDINMTLDAYDMAETVHEFQKRPDGTPYFWHPSRVARIVIEELGISDIAIICAALLHDVLEDSHVLTPEILEYNFGAYTSYLVSMLTKDIKAQGELRDIVEREYVQRLQTATDDAKMLKLCDRLDTFRCLEYNVKKNPIKYVMETSKHYFPLAEKSNDERMKYILRELQKSSNKYLG